MLKLVVGLGNPGPQYNRTRHNAGEIVVRALAQHEAGSWQEVKGGSEVAVPEGRLFIGQDFMNNSGAALNEYLRYHELSPDQIIVAHDELDLPFGRAQLKFGGSAGGHHGVESVIEHLGTPDFWRFRIGIGRPAVPGPTVTDYVLSPFAADEEDRLVKIIDASVVFLVDSLKEGSPKGGSLTVE